MRVMRNKGEKTNAERSRRKREREKAAGLIDVRVKVRTEKQKTEIKRIAKQMCKEADTAN